MDNNERYIKAYEESDKISTVELNTDTAVSKEFRIDFFEKRGNDRIVNTQTYDIEELLNEFFVDGKLNNDVECWVDKKMFFHLLKRIEEYGNKQKNYQSLLNRLLEKSNGFFEYEV